MTLDLQTAARELRDYSLDHAINPFELVVPSPEFYRRFEHEGLLYKVCLTRMVVPGQHSFGMGMVKGREMYLLSVVKLSAVPNERGALLPTEEEGAEVARTFFPRGCSALTDDLDVLKNSRKYLALL
jgi:hypothetical protein